MTEEGKHYAVNPDNFTAVWFAGKYVPKIDFDSFGKEIVFDGDKEELYMLCCYIIYAIEQNYFVKLRPTARDINDELDKMNEVVCITITDNEGKTFTFNTEYVIKNVVDAIRADTTADSYETDKICKLPEVTNTTFLQSMFTVELANFLHYYFPVRRKKDSLVSTNEQDMILKILFLFKLTPVLATRNRFRQLVMLNDKFKNNISWSDFPFSEEPLPISFIKWKYHNKTNWQGVEYEPVKVGETVTFKVL